MAYGYEVVLGFKASEYDQLPSLIDLDFVKTILKDIQEDEIEMDVLYDTMDQFFSVINEKIVNEYPDLLKRVGFNVTDTSEGEYVTAETPKGVRKFHAPQLQFYFDPYELDEKFSDSIIGVDLSSRYFPSLLDWENHHGTLWNFTLTEETMKMIQIAKEKLIEIDPIFEKANVIFGEVHY